MDEINKMSYLDFSIYSERIFKMYEEDEKRKAEEKKAMWEGLNTNFENLSESFTSNFNI